MPQYGSTELANAFRTVRRGVRRGRLKVFGDHVKQRIDDTGIRLHHERGHAEHEQRGPAQRGMTRLSCGGLQAGISAD